jgi:hypothetical protein
LRKFDQCVPVLAGRRTGLCLIPALRKQPGEFGTALSRPHRTISRRSSPNLKLHPSGFDVDEAQRLRSELEKPIKLNFDTTGSRTTFAMARFAGKRIVKSARPGATARATLARHTMTEAQRRIGVLMHLASDDPEAQARIAAFL